MGPLSESENIVIPELLLRWAKILRFGGGWNVFYMHNEYIFTCGRQNSMDLMFLCSTTLLFENLISNEMMTGGWVSERYVGHDGISVFMKVYQRFLLYFTVQEYCKRVVCNLDRGSHPNLAMPASISDF